MEGYTHEEMVKLKKQAREAKQKHLLEESKKRLFKIIKTKITTSFIGAINAFEEEFGFLWAHGEDRPLTREEEDFAQSWEDVRSRILTTGNNQIRAIETELDLHTVEWNRYHVDFRVVQNKE